MKRFSEKALSDLVSKVLANNPKAKVSLLEEAYFFSKDSHKAQMRLSGDPYFSHPLAVANYIADNGFDEVVVSAALLHDVVEDSNVKPHYLKSVFGSDVCSLVMALTKLDLVSFKSRQEHTAANVVKTIIASSKDLRVLVIKLFDKLHNLETLSYLDKERKTRIASDALLIYVPIAQLLGLNFLRRKMEDLCYQNLEPKDYEKFRKSVLLFGKRKEREIKDIIRVLKKNKACRGWSFSVFSKSLYSLRLKTRVSGKEVSELNDLRILRIVVPSVEECYTALGVIHGLFKPVPKKFKDYIAVPYNFLYRALHLQVIGPANRPVKVYIQSKDLFELGEKGAIELLRSKSNELAEFKKIFYLSKKVSYTNTEDLAIDLKFDFLNKSMLVFSEDGKEVKLPYHSSALDFAYFVKPSIAERSLKAKVNGRIVPLWTKLFDGDRVKIIYSKRPNVQLSWLCFASSAKVKRDIERNIKNSIVDANVVGNIKFGIVCFDKPGLVGKQAKIIADNGFNIESGITKVNPDRKTGYSEFIVRNLNGSNLERAIRQLRSLEETISLKVDYFK